VRAGAGAAQLAGRHAVARAEERVEAPQAREAARHRDVDDRHRGIREQALGEEQALRLGVVHRRHAELLLEDAAQVAIGDAQRRGELREARVLQAAVLHQARGGLREAAIRIDHRVAGRELRPAAQARPETPRTRPRRRSGRSGSCGAARLRGAHRAAVDARRADAHEEAPVEAGVVGAERAVALVGVEEHGAIIRPHAGPRSPFSDMESVLGTGCRVRA
jgi:hypothetical protein